MRRESSEDDHNIYCRRTLTMTTIDLILIDPERGRCGQTMLILTFLPRQINIMLTLSLQVDLLLLKMNCLINGGI